jgi:uncharacterized protein YfaS (alpha-2-macroglobulin family)
LQGQGTSDPGKREQLEKQFAAGNYKVAYEGFRALALDPKSEPQAVATDLVKAVECLVKLGRVDEIDAFREAVVAVHRANWRVLQAAAESYLNDEQQHVGYIVAGQFHRGQNQAAQRYAGYYQRDRARALQLLVDGMDRARQDADKPAVGRYFLSLARALMGNIETTDSWRLQALTPLDQLPDYDLDHFGGWSVQRSAAPVEADFTPVYYRVPHSFEKAKSDGARWRWALAQAGEADPSLLNTARLSLATFLVDQFGTQTLEGSGLDGNAADVRPGAAGPYALHTLKDEETIARLASGVKRFTLPDEFNPIKIFQQIAADPKTGHGEEALDELATIFENRRQLDRAAAYWKQSRETYGDKEEGAKARRLDQILGSWGEFQTLSAHPAGRRATVPFRFRNGRKVHFEAHEIDVARILKDVKVYIESQPRQLDLAQINVDDSGRRLIEGNEGRYLGALADRWDMDLEPLAGHLDKEVTVATPLEKAGAYLLMARMDGGNTSRIVIWIDDTIIVKKPLANATYYLLADARTGQSIPGAEVELFGWRALPVGPRTQPRLETKRLTLKTDQDGQVIVPITEALEQQTAFQWLVTASTPARRLAHLGFRHIWRFPARDAGYDQKKVYTITDRPVYRPGTPVRFKFWVQRARYDQPDTAAFAGKSFTIEIRDPKGDKVFTKGFTADRFGGFDGSFELPSDAALGIYQVFIPNEGGGTFRVEEYKKPEFEVKVDAPTAPAMLGERVAATIKANYYFGGPVNEAKVKYKISRTKADEGWYPSTRWDWLYGSGYWWFAPNSSWYPGWSGWGTPRPSPFSWWDRASTPPEVVSEAELPIGPDGTVNVEIDTALAKEFHPDQDQRYEITAEITDRSRRTIVGTGNVLVARKPFAVYTWVDRGHYRAGDTIESELSAQTLDRKPVTGKAALKLLKISFGADGRPAENAVESWELNLDENGHARQPIKAAAAGQYRLSATVTDGQGHTVEGGYLLTITGKGFDGSSFRYGDIELIPERKDYHPGDSLRLLINANQPNGLVLLFVRPSNGVYLPPKLVRLNGKSAIEEIGIVPSDMPNFFVEALTVADGKVHDESREIAIPPVSRVLDLAIQPAQTTYKPGQKATIKINVTGPDGRPFAGSTVVAVYDKAVEYISGGSNVPEIKEFFWKWKRAHHPQTESSFDVWFYNLLKNGETGMENVGLFGDLNADDGDASRDTGMLGGLGGMGTRGATAYAAFATRGAGSMKMKAGDQGAPSGPVVSNLSEPPVQSAFAVVGPPGGPQAVQPTIRSNFADTAYWMATLTSGPDGTAEVEFPLPDSLTTWKVKSWTMGLGTKVGQSDAEIVATKDLLVRLQAPRFFVEKDEVVLSANVHNKLKKKKNVQVVLELDGSVLEPLGQTARSVEIAEASEQRVDWRVKVAHEGEAVIRMKALTDEESDAAQMSFTAYVHGMLKTEAFAGAIRPEHDQAQVEFRVPAERKPEQSRLEVRYSPTLAGALVDALPYLADYPYGCTEQTLNRFLPTAIAQQVLIKLGIDLRAIREKHTNLNAQQLGDARDRAKGWQAYPHNAVFDQAEVAKMARAGIQRLADMQLSDGGWGWFSGYGEHPSPHTTALVVHGLQIARQNDLALPPQMLERGIAWLTSYQAKQLVLLENGVSQVKPFKSSADDVDALVFMVQADAGIKNDRMLAFLERDRTHLSVYAKAMYGLALERIGEKDKLAVVLQNLSQYLVRDDENQTAFLKLPNQGYWWWWYGSEIETHAFYLKLLARTEPRGELAPRLVKFLLNNRKHGTYWNSTRDTAYCIEAMADYLKASGEDRPDMTVAVSLDGKTEKEVKITPADLFTFDNAVTVEGKALSSGEHKLALMKRGKGPLYVNAYLTNFTLEDPITHTGLEIKVDRKVYRLVRNDNTADVAGGRGQLVSQRVERYSREPLAEGAVLKSGELVEVELEIDSKNDYEYLIFEDYKAAGFEPVEVQSGYNGNDLGAYVEFRDERVAFFARALARGKHSVSYRLRAEIPGRFHALPARALAMYAPELRANSDEIQLQVKD